MPDYPNYKHTVMLVLSFTLALLTAGAQSAPLRLPGDDVQNLAGRRASLPSFLAPDGFTLIALSMGVSQDNGEEQVAALQQTHRRLLAALPTYQNARILHLNIIAGAPFFVHGLIRGGLGKSYAAPVQPEQVLVLFAKQAENFARPLGLSVDDRGTWLLVNSAGELQWTLKDDGAVTVELLAERLRN